MELKWGRPPVRLCTLCSNRTFMELKYKIRRKINVERVGSNRTFMELKLD